jgi:hypothetical protein
MLDLVLREAGEVEAGEVVAAAGEEREGEVVEDGEEKGVVGEEGGEERGEEDGAVDQLQPGCRKKSFKEFYKSFHPIIITVQSIDGSIYIIQFHFVSFI